MLEYDGVSEATRVIEPGVNDDTVRCRSYCRAYGSREVDPGMKVATALKEPRAPPGREPKFRSRIVYPNIAHRASSTIGKIIPNSHLVERVGALQSAPKLSQVT